MSSQERSVEEIAQEIHQRYGGGKYRDAQWQMQHDIAAALQTERDRAEKAEARIREIEERCVENFIWLRDDSSLWEAAKLYNDKFNTTEIFVGLVHLKEKATAVLCQRDAAMARIRELEQLNKQASLTCHATLEAQLRERDRAVTAEARIRELEDERDGYEITLKAQTDYLNSLRRRVVEVLGPFVSAFNNIPAIEQGSGFYMRVTLNTCIAAVALRHELIEASEKGQP